MRATVEPRHSRCRSWPIAVARANVAASSACVAIPLRGVAAKTFRRMVSAATMNLPVNAAELVRRALPTGPRLSSYSTAALVASSKDRLRWTGMDRHRTSWRSAARQGALTGSAPFLWRPL
jgi:hypothetical protein